MEDGLFLKENLSSPSSKLVNSLQLALGTYWKASCASKVQSTKLSVFRGHVADP